MAVFLNINEILLLTNKDWITLENVISAIGYGEIQDNQKEWCDSRLIKRGITKFLNLTNGFYVGDFKLKKMRAFDYKIRHNVKFKPGLKTIDFHSSWLAGFLDSSGYLGVSLAKQKYLALQIEYSQKFPYLITYIAQPFSKSIYIKKITKISHRLLPLITSNSLLFGLLIFI